jgi:hypothetical protein
MYEVRRVDSKSPAIYRPRFKLVEPRLWPEYSVSKTLLWIGLVLACLVTLCGGTYFVAKNVSLKPLPDSVNNLPIYLRAQNVEVITSDTCRKVLTFTSDDSPDQIVAFYRDILINDGWRPVGPFMDGFVGPFIDGGGPRPSFIYEQDSLDGTLLSQYGFSITFPDSAKNGVELRVDNLTGNCWQYSF